LLVRPRTRLDGKKTTKEALVQEIILLLQGTSVKRPYPLSVTEVAKVLGVTRQTVYSYIKLARDQTIPRLENGKLCLPKSEDMIFRKFNKMHEITRDPLVSEWMDDLITRRGGNPIVSWRSRIRSLEAVCNTCRINPSDLLVSNKTTEKILRQFAYHCKQGKQEKDSRGGKSNASISGTMYHRAQGIRDFCGFYDMTWKRGVKGVMSQKIINHGKYSDIRLSSEELEKADNFIKERFGLDSDVYRWFWIGIESCARFAALYTMTLDYTKHVSNKTGKITYIMTVYESKTRDIRGGKWYKYIMRPDTQKSIDLLKQRGGTKIHECNKPLREFHKMISASLSEIYRYLGKTSDYFFKHHTHALRHIGAHYWLSKKDYNYGLVSEIGGWNTIDELKKSYGLIPPEKILEIIEE
jgi:hypothetical protein